MCVLYGIGRERALDSAFVNFVLPLANAVIMFGIGLTLRPLDFRRIVSQPRPVAYGIAGHYLLLPLIGFLFATLYAENYRYAIGFMLIAACPSANVSNLLTYLARGNVALAVVLTAISAIVTLASIPLMVKLSTWWFADQSTDIRLPVANTIAHLFVLVVVPIIAGMAVRHFAPEVSRRMETRVARLSMLFLLSTIAIIVLQNFALVRSSILELGAGAAAMCSLAIACGMLMARIAKLPRADVITIGIEVGIQNCMLAFLIAFKILGEPEVAIPAIVYGTLMFIPAFITVLIARALSSMRGTVR